MSRLAVFSHKPCWTSSRSLSGVATDGGFPFQMRALSQLFDETTVVVPVTQTGGQAGEVPLEGNHLRVVPLSTLRGRGLRRKLAVPVWFVRNLPVLLKQILIADAVHAPIPGDVGTFGMLLACLFRKPLLVRHCGNWFVQVTAAEHFWKWFMETFAGGRNVMLATGGGTERPSIRNRDIDWIFSTSLTEEELAGHGRVRSLDANAIRMIIVCRQDREKGTGVVLESLPELIRKFPALQLDVVGDGPALPEFREAATRLGMSGRVTFHGKVNHEGVLSLMSRASLFCYPTRASEGFPKVVLEALACGLPIVTTPVSVLPQLVSGGGGVLIKAAVPEDVVRGVEACLSDPKRYQEMSSRALETARQFSLERWRDTIGGKLRERWAGVAIRA